MELQKLNNSREALIHFFKAEEHLKKFSSVKLQFLTYNNLACYYQKEGNLGKSLHYLSLCLNLQPLDSSSEYFAIGILLNICAVKSKLSLHKEALTHALKAFNMLDSIKNPCLKAISFYSVGLEYEFLSQFTFAMQYFNEGWTFAKKFFGNPHEITVVLAGAVKSCKGKAENIIDQYCILRENSTSMRGRSGFDIRSREFTQKADYYIKVDTTPWIEADSWKFKANSQTPTLKTPKGLRKKFTKIPEEINKSLNAPMKLEEKLNFIGKKLVTLNGKLNNIEKLFTDTSETKKTIRKQEKVRAAIVIQRAFRSYRKEKYRFSTQAIAKHAGKYSNLKTIPFFMMQTLNEQKKGLSPTSEKYIQTSRQEKRIVKKSKGLVQTIVIIQKHIRGFLGRNKYKKILSQVKMIQSAFKMYQVKKIFRKIKNAIIFIQQAYRTYANTHC